MWGIPYIPLEEVAPMDAPCVSLGHFYEAYECIYCAAPYCATEYGGHSFEEVDYLFYQKGTSPLYCHQCKQYRVNISKGHR